MKPRITPAPNFPRFLETLLLRAAHRRPPLFDFIIDHTHIARALDHDPSLPISGSAWCEAYRLLGYDYVQVSLYAPMDELHAAHNAQRSSS